MDKAAWQARLAREGDTRWKRFFDVCETVEGGSRTVWALNLMRDVLERAGPDGRHLAQALTDVIGALPSRPLQRRGLRLLRRMLAADPALAAGLATLPLHLRREPADVLRRQRKLVHVDALPRRGVAAETPWLTDLFRELLRLKRAHWRSSATARQELSMVHKFLRTTGWTTAAAVRSVEEFRAHVARDVTEGQVVDTCVRYLQTFCADDASRRRYRHIFRLLFVTYLEKVPAERFQQLVDANATPEYETLADLDERLSSAAAGSGPPTRRGRKHLTQAEVDRMRAAATRCLDRLVLTLLETTGLRRRGLLNILVRDVAVRDGAGGDWRAAETGRTLTKGAKTHEFRLFPLARRHVEEWLNTPAAQGGRPPSPSPFLFPSARTDDGQMSVSTLTALFWACTRLPNKKKLGALRPWSARRCRPASAPFARHASLPPASSQGAGERGQRAAGAGGARGRAHHAHLHDRRRLGRGGHPQPPDARGVDNSNTAGRRRR